LAQPNQSSTSGSDMAAGSSDSFVPPGTAKRKCKEMDEATNNISEMAAAIRGLTNANMRSEMAVKKLRHLEKEDTRREEEHELQSSKIAFDQWQQVQSNIRMLRQDLLDDSIDDLTKGDLEFDIAGLLRKKNELSIKLGIRE